MTEHQPNLRHKWPWAISLLVLAVIMGRTIHTSQEQKHQQRQRELGRKLATENDMRREKNELLSHFGELRSTPRQRYLDRQEDFLKSCGVTPLEHFVRKELSVPSSSRKLADYVAQVGTREQRFRFFVGMPLDEPRHWQEVLKIKGNLLVLPDGAEVFPEDVKSYIVVYENGEIRDIVNKCAPLPEPFRGLTRQTLRGLKKVPVLVLQKGNKQVKVVHGAAEERNGLGTWYHSTTLTNLLEEKVRVTKFGGGVLRDGGVYIGSIFTAEQFSAWYGLGTDEWILPGQSVCDPNNWSSDHAFWVYFFQTESGEIFTTGSLFER